jgi:hypothetical protein
MRATFMRLIGSSAGRKISGIGRGEAARRWSASRTKTAQCARSMADATGCGAAAQEFSSTLYRLDRSAVSDLAKRSAGAPSA